ncbi:MAG: hypothetical protein CL908_17895 [Deltaproteobacteria bacterium]|nr:hypothetical protein [Deltaproteobacteria bacterium]
MRQNTVLFLGDFDSGSPVHTATRAAVLDAGAAHGAVLNTRWMGPEHLALYPGMVAECHAVVLVPSAANAPKAPPEPILPALTMVRERGLPFLGTGEAHGLVFIEAAREILGIQDAGTALYDSSVAHPVVHRIPWPEEDEATTHEIEIDLTTDSDGPNPYDAIERVVETTDVVSGLNPDYAQVIVEAGFRPAGRDRQGGRPYLHVLEQHPYHVTAAFLPQVRSTSEAPHPLFLGLVAACLAR